MKWLYAIGLQSFDDYHTDLEQGESRQECVTMIDTLTTNKTGFFHEPPHVAFVVEHIVPAL